MTLSLITQFFTNFVLGFFYAPLWDNNRLLMKGINPKLAYELLLSMKAMVTDRKKGESTYE